MVGLYLYKSILFDTFRILCSKLLYKYKYLILLDLTDNCPITKKYYHVCNGINIYEVQIISQSINV